MTHFIEIEAFVRRSDDAVKHDASKPHSKSSIEALNVKPMSRCSPEKIESTHTAESESSTNSMWAGNDILLCLFPTKQHVNHCDLNPVQHLWEEELDLSFVCMGSSPCIQVQHLETFNYQHLNEHF